MHCGNFLSSILKVFLTLALNQSWDRSNGTFLMFFHFSLSWSVTFNKQTKNRTAKPDDHKVTWWSLLLGNLYGSKFKHLARRCTLAQRRRWRSIVSKLWTGLGSPTSDWQFFCSISSAWLKQSHLCSHSSWVSSHRPEERSSHLNRLTNAEGWLAQAERFGLSHCIDTQLNRDCESLDWLPRQPQWEKLTSDRDSSPRLFWRSGLDLKDSIGVCRSWSTNLAPPYTKDDR